MSLRTARLVVLSICVVTGVSLSACSSKTNAAAKKPTKPTTTATAPKLTGKTNGTPKKPQNATAVPKTPPAQTSTPDPGELAGATDTGEACTADGLSEGKGYCYGAANDFLAACSGGTVKALDCTAFADANTVTSCLDDGTTVACVTSALTAAADDLTQNIDADGEDEGTCQEADQANKGFCGGNVAYLCNSAMKLRAVDCTTFDGATTCSTASGTLDCQ